LSAIRIESTKLQYALADRAAQFGWIREQIVVIDDDLGAPRASIEDAGFQRLVAEVGLGKVVSCSGRDVAAGALLPGLASASGDLRAVRHADRPTPTGV